MTDTDTDVPTAAEEAPPAPEEVAARRGLPIEDVAPAALLRALSGATS